MADITMPQLGETVTEGTITKWFKKVGDEVAEDEPLFEVSTDKVDSEVPSPAAGVLSEILVQEGETVDVGAKLAVIGDGAAGGGDGGGEAAEGDEASQPDEEADKAEDADEAEEAEEPSQPDEEAAKADTDEALADDDAGTEEGREPAKAEEKAPSAEGTSKSKEQEKEAEPKPSADGNGSSGSKLLSPVVRRLIAEHNLDPDQIKGTGAGGRITRNDVQAVIEGGGKSATKPEPAQEKAPAPADKKQAPAAAAPAAKAGDRDEVIPFSNIRKRTAEHMIRSKATSAHTLVVIEVDFANVDRVRLKHKDRLKAEEGISLTYLPFISMATVDAIRDFPQMNSSVGDNELIVHHDINLGIAVDINFEGLMVPVIHGADGKRLRAIAKEIADLASRARSKKLGPDDITGGTFTITNAGPYGTLITGPVINQPQIAILSTDGVKKRPVVIEAADGSDAIVIHPTGNLALMWDHRAVDGAYAASFLAAIKDNLETRDWEAEL